ncbi:ATP-binding cassette domain-containing protein [Treponema denticola]|jgi:oligopeptide/dipeptide ABC transporter, ATP-binding protein, C-terminal domain|uniref:Oligopeptide/dipeptide ABC transporter, ATP-binding protein n=1 Tax=Treponema denticola OTK TaxID=999434 RepID=A0A0F6MNF0_TREDN|nr:oligopeptide/dipeptide ABC transporter ATP-binding protein [Treponema denticola]EGC76310.1 oligopeptide/dipeptide ABC transporter [Treponema denticola F0402]EMB20728.1 oligopeptide/dipeptide ABC transporter, ATP-binding protein [Treponema denticola OTK]EMB38987.1 oligopeptide/dipeptide ABC transporter, ATP-binding protein [Treponema denticola ATCC 33520]EMB46474.1 oligopeptide/dipeptide ABC transporter, ATP-binding protein [Treponema denticola AL-2]UTC88145.1 ATP-binding cassette domain-con
MSKILLETRGLKQYFPTGKTRNERKTLKRIADEALKVCAGMFNTKVGMSQLMDMYKSGKDLGKELTDLILDYETYSELHGQNLCVIANDGIDLVIHEGETVGLVGESGCGKSTLGRTILKLYKPTAGEIFFEGENITNYTVTQMMPLRKKMQIIFQDPYSSLNPKMTVGQIIGEALLEHGMFKKKDPAYEKYVKEIMNTCGLADYMIYRYPHEFSGGQRQRIGIARALALKPKFIVCDEAVSALDVSIQSQIINLLNDLQKEFNLSYLFISHDLSVVKHISDRIGVMYLGNMVEFTDKREMYANPLHPYTKVLLSAIPETDLQKMRTKRRILLEGDIPSNIITPTGCKFHTRCPIAKDICKREIPQFKEEKPGHFVACHFSGAEL